MSESIAITLAQVVSRSPDKIVTDLMESMRQGMDKDELLRCIRSSRLSELFKSDLVKVLNTTTASGFLLALQTGYHVQRQSNLEAPMVELAWTGPRSASGMLLRSNLGIFLDTVDKATNRIFLTGYALSSGTEFTQEVVRYLSQARSRGCKVTLALNVSHDNLTTLRQLWPKGVPLPTVLVWNHGQDEMTSLHAKVLIVDGEKLFITSANLTYHGLQANIEVGVLISSPVARELEQHFNKLRVEGILRSIEG